MPELPTSLCALAALLCCCISDANMGQTRRTIILQCAQWFIGSIVPPWPLSCCTILRHNQQYRNLHFCTSTCLELFWTALILADLALQTTMRRRWDCSTESTVAWRPGLVGRTSECPEQRDRTPGDFKLVVLNIALSAMRGACNRIALMGSHARPWSSWRSRSVQCSWHTTPMAAFSLRSPSQMASGAQFCAQWVA